MDKQFKILFQNPYFIGCIFSIISNYLSAQNFPTYWPNAYGQSLDFNYEPPRVDTVLFELYPAHSEIIGTSIVKKNGIRSGFIIESGAVQQPNMPLHLKDTNYNTIKLLNKGVGGSGNGFISFDDSTHYFYTNNVTGRSDTNTYGYYLSLIAPFNFVYFYKLLPNNDIDASPKKLNTGDLSPTHYIVAGNDTIIWCESGVKFFKKPNGIFLVFPASKYYSKQTITGKNVESGIVICKIDKDLNIISTTYQPIATTHNWQSGKNLSIISPWAVNKQNNLLVVAYMDSINKLKAHIESLLFDDNMQLIDRKYLNYTHSFNCFSFGAFAFSENKTFNIVFSPHDSLVYFFHLNLDRVTLDLDTITQLSVYSGVSHLIRIPNIAYDGIFSGANRNKRATMNIAPNGKIYFNTHTRKDNQSKVSVFTIIDQPNRIAEKCRIITGQYLVDTNFFKGNTSRRYKVNFHDPTTRFFVSNEPYSVGCEGITFINKSDTIFKSFTYYFSPTDSVEVTLNQPYLLKKYQNLNSYYLKIKGVTNDGYWAWYSDSINTSEWCKIKANFYTKDSLGCQWIAQTFIDSSCLHVQQANPGERKWIWDFGDGTIDTTYSPTITHIFNQSGTFTVKMKLFFGNCIDSITKNSIIRILPASQPGFELSSKNGCIPFEIELNDTVSQYLVTKMYRFSDETNDSIIPISVNKIHYTYYKPGKYIIKQTLISSSGCITSDSQIVTVNGNVRGVVLSKPYVSVIDDNSIAIFWKNDSNATIYEIFKSINYSNSTAFFLTTDTFYTDNINLNTHKNTYQYAIKIDDQCSNKSEVGNFETSILLQSNNFKNLKGISSWNKNKSVLFYIKKWQEIDSTTSFLGDINYYEDNDFYTETSDITMYQIVSIIDSFELKSNKTKLQYEPAVIIPSFYDLNKYGNVLPIKSFYLKTFNISIYDISGRKVFEGKDVKEWNSYLNASTIYIYRIDGISKADVPFSQIGKILLSK